MYKLKKKLGVYYLFDYYPKSRYATCNALDQVNREKLWRYKDGIREDVLKLTMELMMAIVQISKKAPTNKIGLVAVPTSEANGFSSIKESIKVLKLLYDSGKLEEIGFDKELYDFSGLLKRTINVPKSHAGARVSEQRHMETIECARDYLAKYNTTFILMDDVVTTGTIMKVCRKIIVRHGAIPENIYSLTIGRTVE